MSNFIRIYYGEILRYVYKNIYIPRQILYPFGKDRNILTFDQMSLRKFQFKKLNFMHKLGACY